MGAREVIHTPQQLFEGVEIAAGNVAVPESCVVATVQWTYAE
jgi:hypothetical protein